MFYPKVLPAPQWEVIPKESQAAGMAMTGTWTDKLDILRAQPPVHWLQRTFRKPQLDVAQTGELLSLPLLVQSTLIWLGKASVVLIA